MTSSHSSQPQPLKGRCVDVRQETRVVRGVMDEVGQCARRNIRLLRRYGLLRDVRDDALRHLLSSTVWFDEVDQPAARTTFRARCLTYQIGTYVPLARGVEHLADPVLILFCSVEPQHPDALLESLRTRPSLLNCWPLNPSPSRITRSKSVTFWLPSLTVILTRDLSAS